MMYMFLHTTATATHKTYTTHTCTWGGEYNTTNNKSVLIEFVLLFSLYFWVENPIILKRKINTPPLIELIKFL